MKSTYTAKSNPVHKACSKEGTDVYNYINNCGLKQLIPSKDNEGDICLAFTDLGLITIYIEWGKIVCYHRLETQDIYVTEYSVKGVYITHELESLNIELYQNF